MDQKDKVKETKKKKSEHSLAGDTGPTRIIELEIQDALSPGTNTGPSTQASTENED